MCGTHRTYRANRLGKSIGHQGLPIMGNDHGWKADATQNRVAAVFDEPGCPN